jgi:hypothetical protein
LGGDFVLSAFCGIDEGVEGGVSETFPDLIAQVVGSDHLLDLIGDDDGDPGALAWFDLSYNDPGIERLELFVGEGRAEAMRPLRVGLKP